ncbi:hypothetical protein [uncultured Hyphomicrobium sp.]|uniref:hypothetical protein n=1 Tax=uncultured Hyphomicrobium sp. TaxID=194373 RepID=UPI0025D1F227|nr:hypothetical protein [uncultured Hyphomicrobium sp.]
MRIVKKAAGVALAMTAAAGAAAAASPTQEITGRIEHLNPKGQHLTLRNQVYRYDPRLMGVGLRKGEQVRIFYREQHGHRYAIQILPAA